MDFPKTYDPKESEEKIYKLWEKSGFFNPDKLPKEHKEPYTIVVPPPNVTGELHMGHALNATIQDTLIRWKRMKGFKTLWLPGTDHAGIATQNVVEKKLKKEGKTRFDLGRSNFVKEVWKWKEKYGDIILNQFKRMGSSLDWSRTTFTMDQNYAEAVKTAFSKGDAPEDHESFASPQDGVRAHFNHMAAYVGLAPLGEPHCRYHVVIQDPKQCSETQP